MINIVLAVLLCCLDIPQCDYKQEMGQYGSFIEAKKAALHTAKHIVVWGGIDSAPVKNCESVRYDGFFKEGWTGIGVGVNINGRIYWRYHYFYTTEVSSSGVAAWIEGSFLKDAEIAGHECDLVTDYALNTFLLIK